MVRRLDEQARSAGCNIRYMRYDEGTFNVAPVQCRQTNA
jgi:hypothetical protein